MGKDYYLMSAEDSINALGSFANGLDSEEAKKRLRQYGYNEIAVKERFKALKIFFRQFFNWLILLLIAAAIISIVVGEVLNFAVILGIILLNALFGFFQEYKAEKSIEALRKMTEPYTKTIRGGEIVKVLTREIVIGDIILLEAGDVIPADCRILSCSDLKVNEASLTGESADVEKSSEKISGIGKTITEQNNMLFSSTAVNYGNCKAIVIETGMNTEIGRIAKAIKEVKEQETPLQKKFKILSREISVVFVFLVLIVFILGTLFVGEGFYNMLLFSLALVVASIPESLPIITTISLALGARRLASKNMLIKKLSAAESLGAVSFICSDKTGTLTKDEMTVTKIWKPDEVIDVSGVGYSFNGEFLSGNKKYDISSIKGSSIKELINCAYFNNAFVDVKNGISKTIGDSTEAALFVLAKKSGLTGNYNRRFNVVKEFAFSSERKMSSFVVDDKTSRKRKVYCKGAVEVLLDRCGWILENGKIKKLGIDEKEKILKINEKFASDALRVLGFAYRDVSKNEKLADDLIENNLIFIGLTGMIDPPRDEVKQAIIDCNNAGINVMMITGDHLLTAKAIGKKIGLFKERDIVLLGENIEKMSDSELLKIVRKIKIIARIMPIQKLRIVSALQKSGEVVAVTGDGVNDAPALKKADIGIAMGITGTEISKQVAKAILVDDNFATIVNGVFEGRNIYDKIIKSARYLLSCNMGEVFVVLLGIFFGFPLLLLPLQILMMNLVTDNFPTLGLGMEPADKIVMLRKPRKSSDKVLGKFSFIWILLIGIVIGFLCLFLFSRYFDSGIDTARTIAFTSLVVFQMFIVVSSRNFKFSSLNLTNNPWLMLGIVFALLLQVFIVYASVLQKIFGTAALSLFDWGVIFLSGIIVFAIAEILKGILNKVNINN